MKELTDDECIELWHAGGELCDTIRLIYKVGYDDAQTKPKKGIKRGKQAVKQEPQETHIEPF